MYDLYIFDLDGTLLDSDPMLIETFHELYAKYRPDFHPDDEYIRSFNGPQISVTLKREFPDLDQDKLQEVWREMSKRNYVKCASLYPGAKECLEVLKEKNINVAVVTNKHRYATDFTYGVFGLDGLIKYTVCADEVEHLKPGADGVRKAMEYFGIKDGHKVIYIGDGEIDYETARNAGVDFGFVTWSPRRLAENAKIDVKIDSYPRFAGEF